MATLLELRTEARRRADMEDSNFVTDAELTTYINNSWKELYDLLVSSYEDYYTLPPVSFTISSGNTAPVPADFYKLRGVDYQETNSDFRKVNKFDFEKRNRRTDQELQYRLIKDQIYITPDDNATGDYRLWYVPRANDLVLDADEMDGVNGWEEYVVVDAAIKMLNKEESDVGVLLAQKAALRERIIALSKNRDAGKPNTISDTESLFNDNDDRRVF